MIPLYAFVCVCFRFVVFTRLVRKFINSRGSDYIEQRTSNFVNQRRIAIILRQPLNVIALHTALWGIIESSGWPAIQRSNSVLVVLSFGLTVEKSGNPIDKVVYFIPST